MTLSLHAVKDLVCCGH